MLILAALLLVCVGLMHSLKGGRNLIEPILRLEELPVILGSVERTRFTLRVGWHIPTLTWFGNAATLAAMQFAHGPAKSAFLIATTLVCGATAVAALVLTRGRHLSWVFFAPVAVCKLEAPLIGGLPAGLLSPGTEVRRSSHAREQDRTPLGHIGQRPSSLRGPGR